MDITTKKGKEELIKKHSPKSPILKNSILAFLIGGLICAIGEGLRALYLYLGATSENAPLFVSLSIIFLATLLTALGIFDTIAKRAGAGTLVPISGFANAISSQAIDAKSEGYILGVGAKIFTISGPVILYGLLAGVLYGAIYALTTEIIKMVG